MRYSNTSKANNRKGYNLIKAIIKNRGSATCGTDSSKVPIMITYLDLPTDFALYLRTGHEEKLISWG